MGLRTRRMTSTSVLPPTEDLVTLPAPELTGPPDGMELPVRFKLGLLYDFYSALHERHRRWHRLNLSPESDSVDPSPSVEDPPWSLGYSLSISRDL